MKIYITKYALTNGIHAEEAKLIEAGYWAVEGHYGLFKLNEGFEDLEAAIARAEEMRIKKLQSLDKQIKRISALKFDLKEPQQ